MRKQHSPRSSLPSSAIRRLTLFCLDVIYVGRPRGGQCSRICCEGDAQSSGRVLVTRRLMHDYDPKANCNRLLDVARETYKENVGDIFSLNRDLSERHNLPLSLVFQETGFVFALKKSELEGELPKGFVNVTMQKGRWLFSSIELVGLMYHR